MKNRVNHSSFHSVHRLIYIERFDSRNRYLLLILEWQSLMGNNERIPPDMQYDLEKPSFVVLIIYIYFIIILSHSLSKAELYQEGM